MKLDPITPELLREAAIALENARAAGFTQFRSPLIDELQGLSYMMDDELKPKQPVYRQPSSDHTKVEWFWRMEWCRINGLPCANNDVWRLSREQYVKLSQANHA